ncbi:MAG: Gfo/Idh/MocA family oxidoreductase [Lentisphaerae bacterium]|nr:Gfo/Idh/MocA family oxidoreductase [Lentisphaerota bacterium]
MSKVLRLGFIGAGGIARAQANYLKKVSGVEVVAAADVNQAALDKFKQDYNTPHLFKDWKKLLALPGLEAVSVCTPNNMHSRPSIAALKAGKHVLVEKPMAMNAKQAAAMVAAAKQAKRLLQIGVQWRFTRSAQFLRQRVASGSLGDFLYVRYQALRRRGIPSWGVFGRKELQGGGPMIDIGVHILEMAHYIMGAPPPLSASASCYTYIGNKKPQALTGWGNWDYKTYTVEDLAIGFIKFANGSTLVIESSFAAHIEKDLHTIQIMGSKGGATYDPLQVFGDDQGYMLNMTPAFIGTGDSFLYKMNHFVECARDGKKCAAPGEDGWAVQRILDGVYKAAALKREVRI